MLKKDRIIEKSEMLSVKPQDYLSDGFLAPDGQVREGINGESSLAMAYRLKEEGVSPERLSQLSEKLYHVAGSEGQQDPNQKLSLNGVSSFQNIAQSSKSSALTELFEAAKPWVVDWKNLAAFIVHLERIQAQLAMLIELPKIKR